MITAKQKTAALLTKLPDDASLENIQYHLYVIQKIQRGLDVADNQGTVSQAEAEARLSQWLTE